jgi:prolyl oligopeptidase PreP (S9A serine peptidase family)
MRETLNVGSVIIDPNGLSPDRSIALSGLSVARGRRRFAYGRSQGGSDWSTYYVRELGTGEELPDVIRWVVLSVAWTRDGGFTDGIELDPVRRSRMSSGRSTTRSEHHSRPIA